MTIGTIGDLRSALKKPGRVYVGSAFTIEDVHYVQVVKADIIREIAPLDSDIEITADIDQEGNVWLA